MSRGETRNDWSEMIPRYSVDFTAGDLWAALTAPPGSSLHSARQPAAALAEFSRQGLIWTWDGRTALRLILRLAGLKSGEPIVAPRRTCIQVHRALISEGAVPVFIDASEGEFFPSSEEYAEAAKRSRARFVLVISYWGYPQDLERLREKLPPRTFIIQDCAMSWGSAIHGAPDGADADAAFFSFGAGKPLCLGGGGLAVVSDRISRRGIDGGLHDPAPAAALRRLARILAQSVLHRSPKIYGLLKRKPARTGAIRVPCRPINEPLARAPRWVPALLDRKHAGSIQRAKRRTQMGRAFRGLLNGGSALLPDEPEGVQWNYWHSVIRAPQNFSSDALVETARRAGFELVEPYLEIPDLDKGPSRPNESARWLLGPSLDLMNHESLRRFAALLSRAS